MTNSAQKTIKKVAPIDLNSTKPKHYLRHSSNLHIKSPSVSKLLTVKSKHSRKLTQSKLEKQNIGDDYSVCALGLTKKFTDKYSNISTESNMTENKTDFSLKKKP